MLSEPGHEVIDRSGSGELVNDPAAAQQHDDRNAAHPEAGVQGRVLLGVDLDDRCFPRQSFGYGSHRRCEGDAVRSPGGPELGQHRSRIAADELVEGAVGQWLRVAVQRGQNGMAAAAAAPLALLVGGDPVGRAAGRAGDDMA